MKWPWSKSKDVAQPDRQAAAKVREPIYEPRSPKAWEDPGHEYHAMYQWFRPLSFDEVAATLPTLMPSGCDWLAVSLEREMIGDEAFQSRTREADGLIPEIWWVCVGINGGAHERVNGHAPGLALGWQRHDIEQAFHRAVANAVLSRVAKVVELPREHRREGSGSAFNNAECVSKSAAARLEESGR